MKDIKGYEGLYAADESGRIWSHAGKWGTGKRGRFIKPWIINSGYEVVMLYKDKFGKKFLVHRLIAETLIPNPNNLPYINHKNSNKLDNRPKNLEWCTQSVNVLHARNKGRWNHFGEHHSMAKLTDKKVRQIRALGEEGIFQEEIARIVGSSQSVVGTILRGVAWTHVK